MSEEDQKNIFVDFMQVQDHTKLNPNGTGLGLSICKLIVEKMRGHIDVKSQKNVGTTFSIIIRSKVLIKQEPK